MASPLDAFVAEPLVDPVEKERFKRYVRNIGGHPQHKRFDWPESNFPSTAFTPDVPRRVTSLKDPTIANFPISQNIEDRRVANVSLDKAAIWRAAHERPARGLMAAEDYTSVDPQTAFIRGLVRRGWTPTEAAGAAGNVKVESGFSPQIKSSVPNESSYGFLQWNKERLQGLKNMAAEHGLDWRDPEVQLDWMNKERSGESVNYGGSDERAAYARGLRGTSAPEIAANFGKYVERPKDLSQTVALRERAAAEYANQPREQNLRMYADAGVGFPSGAPTEEAKPTEQTYGSTTGDVIWKKIDPKTYYLFNKTEPKEEEPSLAQTAIAKMFTDTYGGRMPDAEKAMFMHDMAVHGPTEALLRATRHFHVRQLANFNQLLRDSPNDLDAQHQGIQELLDSGALHVDERGDLYSSIPMNREATDRILGAAQEHARWKLQQMEEGQEPQEQPTTTTPELEDSINQQMDQQTGAEE